jgi:PAS domain S-box-containing protein
VKKETAHLLLVEDEEAHTELVRRAFEFHPGRFRLKVADSLREARDYLSGFIPDLVIADLVLPDGKGIELLSVEGEKPPFPLVLMTGHGDEQVAVGAMKVGAMDYVVKSVETLADMPHIAERAIGEWNHIKERKRAEEELRKREHDLNEQVKKLNCLYGLSKLDEMQDISWKELLQRAAALVPPSWQFPEITCARITLEGREFLTDNFKETPWKQACDLVVFGEQSGCLEVFYLEDKPESDEGPFLKEERSLINAIAPHLGRMAERRWAEKALKTSHLFLEIANMHTEMKPLLQEYAAQVRKLTGCDVVGIRLLDKGGNIPHEAYDGFSQRFYESKRPLSVRSEQYTCINVIKGRTDSSLPFYTKGGSFYVNSTKLFKATVSEKDKGSCCAMCNAHGCESVAIVPIRLANQTLGLIHVADRKEDMVPLDMVELLEGIAMQLGTALQRVRAEEALWETKEQMANIFESINEGFFTINHQQTVTYFNKTAEHLLGRKIAETVGHKLFESFPEAKGSIFEKKFNLALREKKMLSFETFFGIRPYENFFEVRMHPCGDGISVRLRAQRDGKMRLGKMKQC